MGEAVKKSEIFVDIIDGIPPSCVVCIHPSHSRDAKGPEEDIFIDDDDDDEGRKCSANRASEASSSSHRILERPSKSRAASLSPPFPFPELVSLEIPSHGVFVQTRRLTPPAAAAAAVSRPIRHEESRGGGGLGLLSRAQGITCLGERGCATPVLQVARNLFRRITFMSVNMVRSADVENPVYSARAAGGGGEEALFVRREKGHGVHLEREEGEREREGGKEREEERGRKREGGEERSGNGERGRDIEKEREGEKEGEREAMRG